MNLIDEVLEAQAEFERRKAAYQAHPSQHAQEDEYEAEAILNELATTAAPKLARALKDISGALPDTGAMRACVLDFEQSYAADDDAKYWRDMAQNLAGSVGEVEDAINRVRMILAEIKKEIA